MMDFSEAFLSAIEKLALESFALQPKTISTPKSNTAIGTIETPKMVDPAKNMLDTLGKATGQPASTKVPDTTSPAMPKIGTNEMLPVNPIQKSPMMSDLLDRIKATSGPIETWPNYTRTRSKYQFTPDQQLAAREQAASEAPQARPTTRPTTTPLEAAPGLRTPVMAQGVLKQGMPFLEQNRPEKVKEIYKALERDHPEYPAEMKARIAARKGKKDPQARKAWKDGGPAWKGPVKNSGGPHNG